MDDRYIFAPIAFENSGVPSSSTRQLLSNLGHRLAQISRESRVTNFLFLRCSVLLQRIKAVLLYDSLPPTAWTDYHIISLHFYFSVFKLPMVIIIIIIIIQFAFEITCNYGF